jgi:ATP-binding cassette subfamily B protein
LICDEVPYPAVGIRYYEDEDPLEIANASVANSPSKRSLVLSVFTKDRARFEAAAAKLRAYTETDGGLEAAVAQDGTNFSGGQKQRLSIARALVRKPEVYIFDDSFSALDFKTDAKLRRALSDKIEDATVFIVAQRVNTVMSADNIIVLDEGRIVGQGKHKELLESCDTYREIVSSQLSLEELA